MFGDMHPIDAAVLDLLGAAQPQRRGNWTPGTWEPGDPHWKRVAKDRARRKAAKKHKQHVRRIGRGKR
jgi:hypothetical protein